MSIHMRSLSPDTYAALENLCSDRKWADINKWMEPETVAWLVWRLRFVEDSEQHFPRGKWATIQRIEIMLNDLASQESKRNTPADAGKEK